VPNWEIEATAAAASIYAVPTHYLALGQRRDLHCVKVTIGRILAALAKVGTGVVIITGLGDLHHNHLVHTTL
jgi:hypothetical protein